MSNEQAAKSLRPRLIWAACWGVWVFVIPVIALLAVRMVTDPAFRSAPVGAYRMPLPAGFVPLLMFVLSTIGLWRLRMWGVYVYGAAGLLGLLMMAFWPGSQPLFNASVPVNALAWALFSVAHATYTLRLWVAIPAR